MASQQFINELAHTPVGDLAEILVRYVKEACASDPQSAAQVLSEAVYSALPADDDAEPPRLVKVADFLEEIGEPPPALVPDFLPSKKLICMSGAAKQGKSLVGLEFLHCVSTGGKLMGRFEVEQPGTVVYFGLEDGGPEIKERLLARGITDIDNFYVCWQSFDMAIPQGFETYKRLIKDLPESPSLVIIDTAREAFRIRDWNDATAVGAVISPLRKWAHKNCTVILITHNNKDKFASGVNKISGSGALVSSCDSYMILENQKVLPNKDLRWDWEMAGRGVKTTKYVLEMNTDNLHIRVLDEIEKKMAEAQNAQDERKNWHKRIAQFLHALDGESGTVKQVGSGLGCLYKFAYDLMREMTQAGDIVKTGESIQDDGPGRPSPLYRLTTKGASNYLFLSTVPGDSPKELIIDDTEDL